MMVITETRQLDIYILSKDTQVVSGRYIEGHAMQ